MHFSGTVYRNPYWETFPLLQITQGCTHNKCTFCKDRMLGKLGRAIETVDNSTYNRVSRRGTL